MNVMDVFSLRKRLRPCQRESRFRDCADPQYHTCALILACRFTLCSIPVPGPDSLHEVDSLRPY
jgi:hypothetical protein